MSVMDTLVSRRTYRRFAQKAVPQDVVDDIVEAVRLSSCGANRQAVRRGGGEQARGGGKGAAAGQVGCLSAAGAGHAQSRRAAHLYVAVVQDTSIPGDLPPIPASPLPT